MTLLIADHSGRLGASIATATRRGGADAAIDAVRSERPDIVLVHADLPPEGGVALARRITALGATVVLALATPDAGRLEAALRVGVRVVVDADASPALLAAALEAALRGDLLLAPGLRDAFDAVLVHGAADPFPQLSCREREVLAALASGADPGRIATRLGLAPKTVGHHVGSIRRKLRVADNAAAARLARGAGLA